MNGIDRTPSKKTLRFYFQDSFLSDDELYYFARWFAEQSGLEFIKPKNNPYFKAFIKYVEYIKENGDNTINRYILRGI